MVALLAITAFAATMSLTQSRRASTTVKSWDFTQALSATDQANLTADALSIEENLSSDNREGYYTQASEAGKKWIYQSPSTRYSNAAAFSEAFVELKANNVSLERTAGLLFARNDAAINSGDQIRIDAARIMLNGSNLQIRIPDCKTGDIVTVSFASGNATAERGITAENATLDETVDGNTSKSPGSGTTVNSVWVVTSDGAVTFKQDSGLNWYSIKVEREEASDEPVAEDIIYDFAAAAAAGENPANLNGGSANGAVFYGWESESKTYSKRQDYKGYTWAEGSVLPAECHVWRRSDRINGNMTAADAEVKGLNCPNQREMAINGLKAGQKVVIEYTGEGEILYATGFDAANPTAEPNTVAVVGDGNKAAVSGTTTIASGAPIHIVSTDNGYFVFRVLKGMVIQKITISDEATPIDPATVVKPNIVTVAAAENGTVKVDKVQAFEGDVVTVTATPAEGYAVESVTVKAADESAIEVSAENTFVMPAQAVTVSATFTDTRVIYDFAAAAAAGENPANLNGGSANGAVFYGWESESKTYSKRQDYKGYTWAEGSVLPAECHVWRRSDRINGNMTAADAEVKGLNCPNQREMAINGLKAGQKVVIEYTGEGEILYATGFDAANPTAEPNTVAIVGDGNKAAISGTTAIPSGTPIHIVSTDNGYFVFRVLKNMVITKITISEETPIDPATVVKPNIVTVATGIENGTVKVDKVQAFEGDVVTVTATPSDGFKLGAITVKAADESAVEVSAENTFVMPAQAVTVSATFTDTRVIYDFAAAAAAGENPENLNGGSSNGAVFYGWENEGKTYSKRQDYKGYQNYAGTNLPAECHVWRRSDRINGNMTAADAEVKGLKCPSQKEMAINGLKAGQKVVIEYSGEGEILYATGYDPANPTAEPNTVAIVGDGNKAAISGTTAIPSGTPIHIVSTDNGYFVFRVLKNMVITKITISEETPIDPATVVKPNKVTLGTAEGGTVNVSQAQAFEGDKVYATFTPAEGYSPSGIVPTVTNDAGEDVTSSITFGEDETGSYLIMPAFNITVSVVFQQLPKFYIIGVNGVWDRTAMTEMTYNKETGKYEYEFAPTATAYFAFADYQQTEEEAAADADWSVFNSTYRYSIGEGDLDATLGETKSLSKVNGTIVLQPGTYKIVVESDFSAVTITGEVAEDTYVVAGNSVALFGAEWDVIAEANKMTLNTTTGLYEITYSNVTLEAGTIEYKIVKNGGSTWIPEGTDNNLTVTIPSAGTYNVTFTFNPETNKITGAATDATGINGIYVDGAAGDIFSDGKPVYNLSGQRVFKGYKGIVIKNGRKIVVK